MHLRTHDESGRGHTPVESVVLATLALFPVLIIESDATSEVRRIRTVNDPCASTGAPELPSRGRSG
jgi:hypothetical protein